jgi:hypothetical protein
MAERKSRFDWLGGRVARCKALTCLEVVVMVCGFSIDAVHRTGQGGPPKRVSPQSVIDAIPPTVMAIPNASAISLMSCVAGVEESRPATLETIFIMSRLLK